MPDKKNNGKGTFVGNALRSIIGVAPEIIALADNFIPGVSGVASLFGIEQKVRESATISEADKEIILKELDKDIAIEQEITKRWEADLKSEHWLPQLIRPLILAVFTMFYIIITILDSSIDVFTVADLWKTNTVYLLGLMVTAYFGSRWHKHIKDIDKKQNNS